MSSVEWLANRIDEIIELYPSERQLFNDAIKQAKAIHEQEIYAARNDMKKCLMDGLGINNELYYEQTFHPDQVDGDGEEP